MRRFRSKRVSLRRPRKGRYGRSRRTVARKSRVSSRFYKLVRTWEAGTLSINCNAGVPYAQDFSADQVPDHSWLKQLFDEYKIVKAKVRFMPTNNSAQVNSVSGGQYQGLGLITTALDYNDGTPPATQEEVMNYGTRRVTRSNRTHVRVLTPKSQSALYNGVLTTAYSPVSRWIPTSHSSVPHYGVKAWFQGGSGDPTTYSYTLKCLYTLTIMYRSPR